MDDVPVKIVERYKPPPLVYQLPQTLANRLAQYSANYYEEHLTYNYDFQLERSVLNQCQHWRRMRQQQQQARQIRQEQHKQERQRAFDAKQKEMLGAVEYPNAADLSSDSDNDDYDELTVESPSTTTSINDAESREQSKPKSINSCNFYNILQPTILSGTTAAPAVTLHKRNSSLNYEDFEYNMNSTPFDNIELKTINDLDILAQVLHQTQLAQKSQAAEEEKDEVQPTLQHLEQAQETELELGVTTLAETKATLDSVNFQVHCDDAQDIPAMYQPPINNTPQHQHVYPHMFYNQKYYPQVSDQIQQQQLYSYQHANGYGTPTHVPSITPNNSSTALLNSQDADAKSKSVPDILRELTTELHLAENRRTRLHSHNESEPHALALTLPKQELQCQPADDNIFTELAAPAQQLAQRISSMGFPLKRVAKVVSFCGIDDKKIIEHLIPLGELMDLGFEETKISAALLKFDNNKDKALDYLIK